MGYSVATMSLGDPVGIVPQNYPLHQLQLVLDGVEARVGQPNVWLCPDDNMPQVVVHICHLSISGWSLLWCGPQTAAKSKSLALIPSLCIGPSDNLGHKLQHRSFLQLGHGPRHGLRQQFSLVKFSF